MKVCYALALVLALESAKAFSVLPGRATRTPTFLKYNIVYPEDDEAPKQGVDPNSVQAAVVTGKSTEAPSLKHTDPNPGSLEEYRDFDELDGDDEIAVDSYATEVGGIVPGFHLSSLCTDD
jgi:hypothetical protein